MKDFWENKKVLITGGTGFIGSHIAKELIKKKAKVTITSYKNKINTQDKNILVASVDLCNFEECLKISKNQDIILNFAAMDGGRIFKESHGAEIFKSNVQIALNILESSKVNNIKKVLIMSSSEVNSLENSMTLNVVDKINSDYLNGYAWSKKFSEISSQIYSTQYGLSVLISRPVNVYGPGDLSGVDKGRVIPTFIKKALADEDMHIMTSVNEKKSFIYVDDLIRFLIKKIESYEKTELISINSDEMVDIKTLAEKIIKITGSKSKIIENKQQKDKSKKKSSKSIKSISNIVNYSIKSPLDKGLQNTVKFYLKPNA